MTQLLTDPALKGKVTLLTEMRDTMGLMMLEQGKDITKFTDEDFEAAIEAIRQAKERSEEHTSELQSLAYLVCRLLLEKRDEPTPLGLCGPRSFWAARYAPIFSGLTSSTSALPALIRPTTHS